MSDSYRTHDRQMDDFTMQPLSEDEAERLDEALDAYEEACEKGQTFSVEGYFAEDPRLRDAAKQRIEALKRMEQKMGSGEPAGVSLEDQGTPLHVQAKLTQLSFHAKGGLGAVYVANDESLHRDVAVKFIHHNLVGDAESEQRFEVEAEVTGRLEHPGVVPLYGIGKSDEGRSFYTMRFIDGQSLDQAIREFYQGKTAGMEKAKAHWQWRQLLRNFVSVCNTIAYAHNRGIVHRDIKPDNVMLGRYDETIVVDWGLAMPVLRDDRFRQSGERTLHVRAASESGSSSGSRAGTPSYMSPEQHSGLDAAPASDIYSLGVVLYKILTGTTPLANRNIIELRQRTLTGQLPKPREKHAQVPRPLEAVCLKALALQPAERYATAKELAEDVERYLADEPVEAYREPFMVKVARWARRNRVPVQIGVGAISVVALITMLASIWLAQLANSEMRAREDALSSKEQSDLARRENLRFSARFLAEKIAYEIDLRWRILETEANSDRLREMMAAINQEPDNVALREPLQSWLAERESAKGEAIANVGWSLYSANGVQVARCPKQKSVGRSYRHRDYFHGLGKDFKPNDPQLSEIAPLQFAQERAATDEIVHMSSVFESTNTGTLFVGFSVPIWDGPVEATQREILGVFCMLLEISDFRIGRNAMIFQTRTDPYENRPGLIISHPQLDSRSENNLPPRVDEQIVEKADQLRHLRDRDLEVKLGDEIIEAFTDPFTGQTTLAAVEPVVVTSRQEPRQRDPGWAVLVVEPTETSAEKTKTE